VHAAPPRNDSGVVIQFRVMTTPESFRFDP